MAQTLQNLDGDAPVICPSPYKRVHLLGSLRGPQTLQLHYCFSGPLIVVHRIVPSAKCAKLATKVNSGSG